MNTRRVISNILLFLLDLLHATALAFATTMLFSNVLLHDLPWRMVLLITLPLTFFVLLLLRSKLVRRIMLLLVLVFVFSVVVLAVCCLVSKRFSVMCRATLTDLGAWVSGVDIAIFAPVLVAIVAVILSALIVTFGRRTLCWAVLLPPIALAILSLFGARFPMWQLVMYAAFAIALILRRKFDLFLELLKKARGSTGSKPLKGAPHPLLRGACLLAAAMIITLVLHPKPVEGPLFGSKFSESISSGFENFILSHPKLNDFFVNKLGIEIESRNGGKSMNGWFNSRLGGARVDSNEPMLEVLSSQPKEYLRGFVYTDYRGDRWVIDEFTDDYPGITALTSAVSDGNVEIKFKTATYVHAMLPSIGEKISYASSVSIPVYTTLARRRSFVRYVNGYDPRSGVYLPEGTVTMSLSGDKALVYPTDANRIWLSRGLQAATRSGKTPEWSSYGADYYTVTAEMIESYRLYEICVPGYYSNGKALTAISGIPPEIVSDISQYYKMLQYQYKQLPANLPQRVSALAEVLTRGCTDDWHKALAIRNYLCSGQYKYTLTPGDLPAGRDFVDYFLFDSKEGYCTYFASAMTVLARAAGIPARYVEGFLLSDNRGTVDNIPGVEVTSNGWRVLTGANQHAWCEIYMEGLGFVTMEATVGYGADPAPSTAVPTTVPTVTPEPTATPVPTATPEPTLRPVETPVPTTTPRTSSEPGISPTPDPQIRSKPFNKRLPLIILLLIILAASGILTYVILRALFRASNRIPGSGAKEPGEQTVAIYRRSVKLLGEISRVRRGPETPGEYLEALKPYLSESRGKNKPPVLTEAMLAPFAELSAMYELAEYGDNVDGSSPRSHCADAETDASARTEWQHLVNALRARLGKFRTRLLLIKTMGKE